MPPQHHRHGQARGQPEDVKERKHRDDHLAARLRRGIPGRGLAGVGYQVVVAEHRALGRAGGAAGVLQHRDVTDRVHRDLVVPGMRFLQHFAQRQEGSVLRQRSGQLRPRGAGAVQRQVKRAPLERGQVLGQGGDDHVLYRRSLPGLGERVVQAVEDDGDPRAAVGQLGPQLLHGIERVVHGDDAAPAQHREEGDDLLRAVRQDERDPVAGVQAQGAEHPGEPVRRPAELPVGNLVAEEHQRGTPGEAGNRVVEEAGNRGIRHLDFSGYSWRVPLQPRLIVVTRIHGPPTSSLPDGPEHPSLPRMQGNF